MAYKTTVKMEALKKKNLQAARSYEMNFYKHAHMSYFYIVAYDKYKIFLDITFVELKSKGRVKLDKYFPP